MPERSFQVQGRVQGVGFRWWTRAQARRLGVRGSVRSRVDGSVESRASGSDAQLADLRRVLSEGPPGASVTSIVEAEVAGIAEPDFVIVP
jgi:acylphosphatase